MANNPTLGFRVSPDLMDWLREIRPRAGYEGTDLCRVVLETLRAACGEDVPAYPFDLHISITLRDSRATGSASSRGTAHAVPRPYYQPERAVAEGPGTHSAIEAAPPAKRQGKVKAHARH